MIVRHARLLALQVTARGIREKTQKLVGKWATAAAYQAVIGPIVTTWTDYTVPLYPSPEEGWGALNLLREGPDFWLSLKEIPSLDLIVKCI